MPIEKTENTYLDKFGIWESMNETQFQSFITSLYNFENWSNLRKRVKLINDLSSIIQVDSSKIRKWFDHEWTENVLVSFSGSRKRPEKSPKHSDYIKEIDGDYRKKTFLKCLLKCKNWKNPTDYELKVLKKVTGRKCRLLREIFNRLAESDNTENASNLRRSDLLQAESRSSSSDANLAEKKLDVNAQYNKTLKKLFGDTTAATIDDKRVSENSAPLQNTESLAAINVTAPKSSLTQESKIDDRLQAELPLSSVVVNDGLSVNEIETPSTAETSNDLSSDAQTVAHSATSINSTCTSSRATGTAAVNDTNGSGISFLKIFCYFSLLSWILGLSSSSRSSRSISADLPLVIFLCIILFLVIIDLPRQ